MLQEFCERLLGTVFGQTCHGRYARTVGFGQTSHLAVVLRHSELRLKDSVTLRGRLFEVAQTWFYWTWLRRAGGAKIIQDVRAGYSATGLPPQRCSKRLRRRTLDGHLDGRAGILTPNAKRVVLLAFLLSDIVKRKACCGSLLDGGAVVSALQMRSIKKGMLSLFDAVYSEQRKNTEGFAEQMMSSW